MSLNLGLGLGVSHGGGGGVTLATGRVLNLDMTTGQDYSALSVTTSSAIGLVPVYAGDGVKTYVPKTAAMLAGWDGVRQIRNKTQAWVNTGAGSIVSTGITPAFGNKSGKRLTGGTANELFYTQGALSGYSFRGSYYARRVSGSGAVKWRNTINSTGAEITLTSSWQRFTGTPHANGYIGVTIVVPGDVIEISNDQIEIDFGFGVPSMYIDETSSSGWITDPVTGERAYHLGSGVALSWTKPGGSVDGNGVFTPALGDSISGVRWTGPKAATTNLCLYSRDLTNAAWIKTNAIAAKTATGIDGATNSASTLTATAGNATCLQAITSASSTRRTSAFVKRRTGSGVVEMTQDGGATWTAVTVTSSWARVDIPSQTLANLSVGFRIVTSGDAIDIDVVQQETGTVVNPPIDTVGTILTRLAETVAFPQAIGDNWTTVVGLDLSGGLGSLTPRLIGASNTAKTPLYMYLTNIYSYTVTYNELIGNTLSTSTTKVGARRASGKPSGKIGSTVFAALSNTHDMSDATGIVIGSDYQGNNAINSPISTVQIWKRALSDAEFTNA